MVLAVAHGEKERAVLDLIREVRAPFSPRVAVGEFCELLKAYHISEITGDRYSAEWVKEAFEHHRVRYIASERNRSEIYLEFLPALASGQVELLDHDRMKHQLAELERRTGAGRDTVDHPVGGADDVANAAAGALVLALPSTRGTLGVNEYLKGIVAGIYTVPERAESNVKKTSVKPTEGGQAPEDESAPLTPRDGTCPRCAARCIVKLFARFHCNACALDFGPLPEVAVVTRADYLSGR